MKNTNHMAHTQAQALTTKMPAHFQIREETLKKYKVLVGTYVDGLTISLRRGDYQQIEDIAHKLSGSAPLYGFDSALGPTYELRHALAQGEPKQITEKAIHLSTVLRNYVSLPSG